MYIYIYIYCLPTNVRDDRKIIGQSPHPSPRDGPRPDPADAPRPHGGGSAPPAVAVSHCSAGGLPPVSADSPGPPNLSSVYKQRVTYVIRDVNNVVIHSDTISFDKLGAVTTAWYNLNGKVLEGFFIKLDFSNSDTTNPIKIRNIKVYGGTEN